MSLYFQDYEFPHWIVIFDEVDYNVKKSAIPNCIKSKRLGSGGFEEVSLLIDKIRGSPLALKELNDYGGSRIKSSEREYTKRLDHINIIKIHQIMPEKWILMEYANAGSVKRGKKESMEEAKYTLHQLANEI